MTYGAALRAVFQQKLGGIGFPISCCSVVRVLKLSAVYVWLFVCVLWTCVRVCMYECVRARVCDVWVCGGGVCVWRVWWVGVGVGVVGVVGEGGVE